MQYEYRFFNLLMQSQSMQYCFMTLAPQQSPPSNMQKGLLFTSSHELSEIQLSSPPALTEIFGSFEDINLISIRVLMLTFATRTRIKSFNSYEVII